MSKQIRVSDAAYAVLTREAKANHRSILADQVDAMVLPPKVVSSESPEYWQPNELHGANYDPSPTPLQVTEQALREGTMPEAWRGDPNIKLQSTPKGPNPFYKLDSAQPLSNESTASEPQERKQASFGKTKPITKKEQAK